VFDSRARASENNPASIKLDKFPFSIDTFFLKKKMVFESEGLSYGLRIGIVPLDYTARDYAQLVTRLANEPIPLHTIPLNHAHVKSAFSLIKWGKAKINLKPDEKDSNRDWARLVFHKRVLGVIGVVDCAQVKQVRETCELFRERVEKEFPDAIKIQCFAFNPQEDLPDEKDIVVIPPTLGNSAKQEFYLNTWIADFAAGILQHVIQAASNKDVIPTPLSIFDQAALHAKTQTADPFDSFSPNPLLDLAQALPEISPSPAASQSKTFSNPAAAAIASVANSASISSNGPANMSQRLKKIRSGRIQKLMGDFSLLIGSPSDAAIFYQAAADISKSCGDILWRAAALEDLAAAEYYSEEEDTKENKKKISQSSKCANALKHLKKAAELYARKERILNLKIECLFKTSKFVDLAAGEANSDEFGKAAAAKFASQAYEICESLSAQEQISIAIEAALICKSLGFYRKSSLFIREASLLYSEMYQWSSSQVFALLASDAHGLRELCNHLEFYREQKNSSIESDLKAASKEQPVQRWLGIQKACLEELLFNAINQKDYFRVCVFATFLLRMLVPILNKRSQEQLIQKISENTPPAPKCYSVDLTGLPLVISLRIIKRSDSNKLITQESIPKNSDDLFLFNPFSNDKKSEDLDSNYTICVDEIVYFEVFLLNPLLAEMNLQNISISTSGVKFEAFFISSVVLDESLQNAKILLSGKALEEGTLNIRGVQIQWHGLIWEHLVDENGFGINVSENIQLRSKTNETAENKFWKRSLSVIASTPIMDIDVSSRRLNLFNGELSSCDLTLSNSSNIVIEFIHLNILEKFAKNSSQNQDSYYTTSTEKKLLIFSSGSSDFLQNLPLHPSKFIKLPLKIHAQRSCESGDVSISYGCAGNNHFREAKVQILLDVQPSIEFKSIRLLCNDSESVYVVLEIQSYCADILHVQCIVMNVKSEVEEVAAHSNSSVIISIPIDSLLNKSIDLSNWCSEFCSSIRLEWSIKNHRRGIISVPESIKSSLSIPKFISNPVSFVWKIDEIPQDSQQRYIPMELNRFYLVSCEASNFSNNSKYESSVQIFEVESLKLEPASNRKFIFIGSPCNSSKSSLHFQICFLQAGYYIIQSCISSFESRLEIHTNI
jgi:hypothetical protein